MTDEPKKIRVLTLFAQREAREIIRFLLESRMKLDVIEAKSGAEAASLAKKDLTIQLMLCEYPHGWGEFAPLIASLDRWLPVILVSKVKPKAITGSEASSIVATASLDKPAESIGKAIDQFMKGLELSKTVSPDEQETEKTTDQDFLRVRPELLKRLVTLRGDVFIRLSQEKFVRLFHQGDSFDPEDYDRYAIKKGIEYLYIRRIEASDFVDKLSLELDSLIRVTPIPAAEFSKLYDSIHESVGQLIQSIGLTDDIQELVKKSVEFTVEQVSPNSKLSLVLKTVMSKSDNYISNHSHLISEVASTLAIAMDWKSSFTLYKLNLAAFLHDLSLTNQELAMISTLPELEAKSENFTEAEKRAFKLHPTASAEFAKQFNEVPPDVDLIIAQHHERPDGSGFPHQLMYTRISPLAALFIVTEDLVRQLIFQGPDFRLQDFIESKREFYSSGVFKRLLECLSKT